MNELRKESRLRADADTFPTSDEALAMEVETFVQKVFEAVAEST
ncbi:MAG: hypothetical protein ACR2NT_09720 [Acidimicrobiia bacterium]